MKVYKIRRKSDGLFLQKDNQNFGRIGKTYTKRCYVRVSVSTLTENHEDKFNDCEVVEYELKECGVIDPMAV